MLTTQAHLRKSVSLSSKGTTGLLHLQGRKCAKIGRPANSACPSKSAAGLTGCHLFRALKLGVNHLDTSDAYGPHTNETLIGALPRRSFISQDCIEGLAQFWQLDSLHILQQQPSTAYDHARLQAKLYLTTEKIMTSVQNLEYVMSPL